MLRFIDAGEVFNEIGALAKQPNPATAMALEESGIWLIPRQALEEVVLAHSQIALQVIENMADKIIGLVTLAEDHGNHEDRAHEQAFQKKGLEDGFHRIFPENVVTTSGVRLRRACTCPNGRYQESRHSEVF